MSVKLRMKRMGRRHRAYYRIQVVDSRQPRDGRAIEDLGRYDPLAKKESQLVLNKERIEYWLGVGAQPSATVGQMFKKNGIKPAVAGKAAGKA